MPRPNSGHNSSRELHWAQLATLAVFVLTGLALAPRPALAATGVTVSISPTYAVVQTGQTLQLTATVQGTGNTAVTWQVDNANGGTSATGTVSASGLYAAPSSLPSPAIATITAVSQADPAVSASAVVTLVTQPATGTTYYVSTSGNDSNPGTISQPWRTIQHAADSVTAGDTVYVRAGVYNEIVTIPVSGSASSGFVTFSSYPGELATVDGTGLSVPNGQWGLYTIQDESYIIIQGFEIRNYITHSTADVPIGIYIFGAGSNVQIVNNHIHNIETLAPTNPEQCGSDAFGLTVYGTKAPASINALAISGNEVDHLKTGCSETLSVDGNVENFSIANNLIHDNDNIGIDAIGFEGVSPNPAYDQARDGEIRGNTVYNITSYGNPDYGKQYAADGIYVDGGKQIIIEQNLVHNCDLNMEAASEHFGHDSSYITIRNNVFYDANTVGISIGGYSNTVGGSDHVVMANNTLYNNNTKNQGGEFQIQYHSGSQSGNIFENNIVYAGTQNVWIYSYVKPTSKYPAPPATMNWNLYYSTAGYVEGTSIDWAGKSNFKTYAAYQSSTGEDADSPNANPLFINLNSSPPNLDLEPNSPAVNAGGTGLTCSVGYCGNGSSIYGSTDFAGNPRINSNGQINIGAYEQ